MKTRKIALILSSGLMISLFSGCFLFRKKNKCDTCPHFHHVTPKKHKRF